MRHWFRCLKWRTDGCVWFLNRNQIIADKSNNYREKSNNIFLFFPLWRCHHKAKLCFFFYCNNVKLVYMCSFLKDIETGRLIVLLPAVSSLMQRNKYEHWCRNYQIEVCFNEFGISFFPTVSDQTITSLTCHNVFVLLQKTEFKWESDGNLLLPGTSPWEKQNQLTFLSSFGSFWQIAIYQHVFSS